MRRVASPLAWLVLVPALAAADPWSDEAIDAARAYEDSRYEESEEKYEAAVLAGESRPEIVYNLGAARYRAAAEDSAGLAAALAEFERAASRGGAELRSNARYNAATMKALLGDVEGAMEGYKEVLRENPADQWARYNLELLQRLASQQQQQQQEQQDQQESGDEGSEEQEPQPQERPEDREQPEERPQDAPPDEGAPGEEDRQEQQQPPPGGAEESEPQEGTRPEGEPREAPSISPEEALRQLDKLEEEERELLRQLLLQRQRRVDVDKDW